MRNQGPQTLATERFALFWRRLAPTAVHSPLLPFLVPVLVLLIAQFACVPIYDTNDDAGIRRGLEGRFLPGMPPTGDAYFINYYLSSVLVFLYRLAPGIPWYDVYCNCLLLVALGLAIRLLQIGAASVGQAAAFGLTTMAFLAVFARIQFTSVTILACMAGAAALIFGTTGGFADLKRGEQSTLAIVAGAVLFCGELVRFQAALLSIGAASVGFILCSAGWRGWLARIRTPERFPSAAMLFLALALGGAAWFGHLVHYSTPEWEELYRFNFVRDLVAASTSAAAPAVSDRQGADIAAVAQWVAFDDAVFTPKRMDELAALSRESRFDIPWLLQLVKYAARTFLQTFPLLMGTAGFLLMRRGNSGLKSAAIYVTLGALGILILAAWLKPPPWRIVWPLASGMLLVLCLCGSDKRIASFRRRATIGKTLTGIAIALGAGLVAANSFTAYANIAQARADILRSPLALFSAVLALPAALPLQYLDRPLQPARVQHDIPLLNFGAFAHAPPVRRLYSAQAVLDSTCLSAGMPVIANRNQILAIETYFAIHRNRHVSFDRIYASPTFELYRCREETP